LTVFVFHAIHILSDKISTFPSAIAADDVEDFCALAQYYSTRTPQSFRRVSDVCYPMIVISLLFNPGLPKSFIRDITCIPEKPFFERRKS
jgi:hypothetical protein